MYLLWSIAIIYYESKTISSKHYIPVNFSIENEVFWRLSAYKLFLFCSVVIVETWCIEIIRVVIMYKWVSEKDQSNNELFRDMFYHLLCAKFHIRLPFQRRDTIDILHRAKWQYLKILGIIMVAV